MMDTYIVTAAITVSTALIGGLVTTIRNIHSRLEILEKQPLVTEQQVRQILSDKIDPVKEDVSEIRKTLDYIFNLVYNK